MTRTPDDQFDTRHAGDRIQTAWLLRAIRRANPAAADDMIDWVFASVPENPHVRRLKIEHLLRSDDLDAADALIAQWLLRRPSDPAMSMLRARSLLRQGRLRRADEEIRFVLRRRPHHIGARLLSADIASGLGDHGRAVQLLQHADTHRPDDESIRGRLVEALIGDGRPCDAESVLRLIARPMPKLKALLRQAQGRWLDAAAILRDALAENPESPDAPSIRYQLMDLLEQIGDATGVQEVVASIDESVPELSARAASALLWLGQFRAAAIRAARVVRRRRFQHDALHTLIVAATLAARPRLARCGLRRLQATRPGIDRSLMAAEWRKGLLASLTLEQRCARVAGADPSCSVLRPLLCEAIGTLEEAIRSTEPGGSEAERFTLQTHRANCLAAVGRRQETLAGQDSRPAPAGPPPGAETLGRIGPGRRAA